MRAVLRCCVAVLLGMTSLTPVSAAGGIGASGTITETLSVTFLTPAVGWRMTDRWNPNSGARGPVVVWRSDDGGVRWRAVGSVADAGKGKGGSFDVYTAHILFADVRDGWLYGERLFATHDGGRSWRRLPLRGSQTSVRVAGRSVWRLDSACSAATNQCRLTLLSSMAGSDAWQVMRWKLPRAVSPPSSLSGLLSVSRADPSDAWLVTGPYMVNNHMLVRLVGTADGGHSWHPLPMPCSRNGAGSMYARVVPYSAKSLWIFCASQPSAGEQPKSAFRSSDGGRSWRMVADSGGFGNENRGLHNLSIGGYLNDAAVTSANDAWIALSRGTLLHTADGGRTWRAAIPYAVANPGDGGVGPVLFVDARHGWLVSFPNLLFRTTDGGRHWRMIRLG